MLLYMQRILNARKEDKGASAVEYGLLVAAIAAIIVLIVFALGKFVRTAFQDTCTAIGNGDSSASTDAGVRPRGEGCWTFVQSPLPRSLLGGWAMLRNRFLRGSARDEDGASAVEYGLLVAAIAALIVLIVFALGKFVHVAFDDTCTAIANGDSSDTTVPESCV